MELLPDPDISWDLSRLTDKPSREPSPPPSSSPTQNPTHEPTPNPTPRPSPAPSNPPTTAPPTKTPTDEPTNPPTPNPTPVPVTPAPVTPAPVTPAPAPVETLPPTYHPTYYPTATPVQTYFYCPPPDSRTVEARDANGSDVLIEIPPPISTVTIDYEFQVQMLEESGDVQNVLPGIRSRLGESLSNHTRSNTGANNESSCGGMVEDFRRRKLLLNLSPGDHGRTAGEDVPTRIIEISSAKDLTVDENQSCVPRNDGCYVVHGELEATYVGYNEAGVKSSIARAVKEEMVDSSSPDANNPPYDYNLQFLGIQDEEYGGTQTTDGSIFSKVRGHWQDVMPDTSGAQSPTPYGTAILAVLGTTFLVLCYIVFVKSDATDKVKDEIYRRKEKKASKRKALGDVEKESDSSDYCYDLESVVAIDDDYSKSDVYDGGGIEVRSVSSKDSSSRDSGKTKKISNKAHESNYADMQKLDSLLEVAGEEDETSAPTGIQSSSGGIGSHDIQTNPRRVSAADAGCSMRSSNSHDDSSVGLNRLPDHNLLHTPGNDDTRLVDRTPSCVTSARSSPSPNSTYSIPIYQLPSISEAELPPPMNDTPKHHGQPTLPFLSKLERRSSEESDQEFEV